MRKISPVNIAILLIVILTIATWACCYKITVMGGNRAGYEKEVTFFSTWSDAANISEFINTYRLEEAVVPDEIQPGDIIIWIRYGCKDCEAFVENAQKYMDEHNMQPYWYSTRSYAGKEIYNSLDIRGMSVPSATLVLEDGETVTKSLYDADTNTVLTENLDRLYELKAAYGFNKPTEP